LLAINFLYSNHHVLKSSEYTVLQYAGVLGGKLGFQVVVSINPKLSENISPNVILIRIWRTRVFKL
jgi:hypothetical protein